MFTCFKSPQVLEMKEVLLLCHGQRDQTYGLYDPQNVTTLSIDKRTKPHICADITCMTKQAKYNHEFKLVISMFCPCDVFVNEEQLNETTFKNIAALLSPGGFFIFSLPDSDYVPYIENGYGTFFVDAVEVVNMMSTLKSVGLTVCAMQENNKQRGFPLANGNYLSHTNKVITQVQNCAPNVRLPYFFESQHRRLFILQKSGHESVAENYISIE